MFDAPTTIVETRSFANQARNVLTDEERIDVATMIAYDPKGGAVIRGTGGLRKVRFGTRGRGKRGSTRIIYYSGSVNVPIFLLAVFNKGEKDDLTMMERRSLARAVKALVSAYVRGAT